MNHKGRQLGFSRSHHAWREYRTLQLAVLQALRGENVVVYTPNEVEAERVQTIMERVAAEMLK